MHGTDPMIPNPFCVQRVRKETHDTCTIEIEAEGAKEFAFLPGQFNMLYVFGVGEVPISISGDPDKRKTLIHTLRTVGTVTQAIARLKKSDVLGIRGPFGSHWPVEESFGNDVVIVAGGIGLAPLRPAIYQLLAHRDRYGKVAILYGTRTPADILFMRELEHWRGRFDLNVQVTVDTSRRGWSGHVGVVPKLISRTCFDPVHTSAMICGPEVMMRFTIPEFTKRGLKENNIFVSMERNMKCAIGFCGHCQYGPTFICKDGPVFRLDRIQTLFAKREL
jgi:NAD(P)H-flavin reductase